jgi:gliding motility-associated-like protein
MKTIKIQGHLIGLFISLSICSFGQTKTINQGEMTIIGTAGSVSAIENLNSGVLTNDGDLHVYNHYTNNGIVTFTNGLTTGLTRMRGLFGFQNIAGTNQMRWYNCEFDNSLTQPAFHLSNQISISGNANFLNGIVDDDNFGGLAIFENLATHINVDNNSHVDGFVRKIGNQDFIFPIGDSNFFRYAAISEPNTNTDVFSGKYFFENSNAFFPHANKQENILIIDDAEYWQIDKTSSSSDVFITLTWNPVTTPNAIFASPIDDIHIVRWDVSENKWIDEGGIADALTNEVTTVINPQTEYGIFTLARVKNILPCNGNAVIVHNYISPNNDTINDVLKITGIENCPNNNICIYNRWGVKVYETHSYDTNGNTFNGYSQGRTTVNSNEKLPFGTYFYIIEILNESTGDTNKLSGYIFIN